MALALFNTETVIAALKTYKLGVELFGEFPQNNEAVRYGIYVSDVTTVDRNPYQLAVNYGGNIYMVSDAMDIIFVTFQGDKNKDRVLTALQGLVENNVLMDGYHQRDYTVDENWVNRAEYKTFSYTLKRIELQ
jgi:hypothetical protein